MAIPRFDGEIRRVFSKIRGYMSGKALACFLYFYRWDPIAIRHHPLSLRALAKQSLHRDNL
ncbi:MAG: hypothetical protein ABIK39_00390 [candidate division WOR-3 bacterium]